MSQRITIAIDIDDVLSRSAEGFVAFSNNRWGMELTVNDYHEAWAKVWGVSLKEAEQKGAEFHKSGVIGTYIPHSSAYAVLKRLSQRYRLVVITSRRETIKALTDDWLDRHFPNIFDEVQYAGIWDKRRPTDDNVEELLSTTKADICSALRVNYLIDDQPKHCIGAAQAGIKSLLFGKYPWNESPTESPEGMTRVHDWGDVARYFDV